MTSASSHQPKEHTRMTYARPALDLIGDLRRGKAAHDLTEQLHDLIAACRDTGKKGELVLKLTVEPDKDDENRMKVVDQIATKKPSRTVKPSLFFVDLDGNLTRSDPGQTSFDGMSDATTPTAIDRKKA